MTLFPQNVKQNKLDHNDLKDISKEMEDSLISYLNLPHVGCINDVNAVPKPENNKSFELPSTMRALLKRRRDQIGEFKSLKDFIAIDGFGNSQIREITNRLEDLSRYGHRAKPVWGGPTAQREFFKLLESATKYIHISTYIIGGQMGLDLATLLAKKMREGVKVRLFFCATGFIISGSPSGTGFVSRFSELRSWMMNDMYVRKQIVKQLNEDGVPFVNNVPIGRHWRRRTFKKQGVNNAKSYEQWGKAQGICDQWLEEQSIIDKECALGFANVDHRKMVIVDGNKAFVGSQNLADSYFYPNELSNDPAVNRKNWQWHDNSTIIEGGAVKELNRLFAMRWMLSGGDMFDWEDSFYSPLPQRVGNAAVHIEATIPGVVVVPWSKNWAGFLLTMIGGDKRPISFGNNSIRDRLMSLPEFATKDFYVEHCYPADSDLLENWSKKARSIPNFNMIVPLHYDTNILGSECDRYFPELLKAGVKLHGYDRAIMHSKTLVMDGYYVATGSYNLNLRSARADLENEFFIQCSEYGGMVRDAIQNDCNYCSRVNPSSYDKYRSKRSIPFIDAILRYLIL